MQFYLNKNDQQSSDKKLSFKKKFSKRNIIPYLRSSVLPSLVRNLGTESRSSHESCTHCWQETVDGSEGLNETRYQHIWFITQIQFDTELIQSGKSITHTSRYNLPITSVQAVEGRRGCINLALSIIKMNSSYFWPSLQIKCF